VAFKVTAALVQRDTLAGAEDEALVTLAALSAWRGTALRGRQVRAGVGAAAGAHRVVAEARAPHGGH
jgi:hypothetical protein